MRRRVLRFATAFVACAMLALAPAACDDDDPTGVETPPDDHVIDRGGALHADGYNDPTRNCSQCHGPDLRGGDRGQPSCYECHGQEWP